MSLEFAGPCWSGQRERAQTWEETCGASDFMGPLVHAILWHRSAAGPFSNRRVVSALLVGGYRLTALCKRPPPSQGTLRPSVTSPWVKTPYIPPVNIPIPTKIGSKMIGAPIPKWDLIGFDHHSHIARRDVFGSRVSLISGCCCNFGRRGPEEVEVSET